MILLPEGFTSAEQIMMAKVGSKVQEQEKIVKKKTLNARLKKASYNPPELQKVKKKSSESDIRNPLDRIRHPVAQKERNVAQQNNKQQDKNTSETAPTQLPEVTKREQAQVGHRKSIRLPALERLKKSEVKVLRRLQNSAIPSKQNVVPLRPALCSFTTPLPFTDRENQSGSPCLNNVMPLRRRIPMLLPLTNSENQATSKISCRAQALLVEMIQQSRIETPGAQQHGLSALATELPLKQKSEVKEGIVATDNKVPRGPDGEGINHRKENIAQAAFTECAGESNYLQEDDVTQIMFTEVSESTEPRFITPKQVSLFEDWRPGSQKLDLPPSVDRNHWLRVEIEKQQDLRLAQKKASRKREMRYLRRFEGADDAPLSMYSSQSIANSTIREDVEEQSARDYAKFLYRPGAAWKNLGSDSASTLRSFGPLETESRPTSFDSRKSTTEIVLAISSASARREAMRKELAERLQEDLLRKKLLISQTRAASRVHLQCKCCC